MIEILMQVITIFGASYVFGHSQISLVFRTLLARNRVGLFFVQLLECPACFSFHAGWLTTLTINEWSSFPRTVLGMLSAAFFFAGTSFLLGRLTGLMPNPSHQIVFEENARDDLPLPPT